VDDSSKFIIIVSSASEFAFVIMNCTNQQRRKHRSSPPQPLDRHLAEIDESDGTIYINAGIDSTW